MLKNIALLISVAFALFCLTACSSTQPPIVVEKTAIEGYDPVSYFVSGNSALGDAAYTYTYKESEWSFQNQENLDTFKAAPEKFLPLYNGFCAYEMADAKRVKSDPKIWHIYNKKLYLFSDEKARQLWFRDISKMIEMSNKAWNKMAPVTISAATSSISKASEIKDASLKQKTLNRDEPASVEDEIVKAKNMQEIREVALNGYDPVAYFDLGKPYMSDGHYVYTYNKTEWFFRNSENLEKFKANPQAYMPVYSGFCAYELSFGNLVESDPQFWHIYNKKLYLFSSEYAKEAWYKEISKMTDASDKAWKRMTP